MAETASNEYESGTGPTARREFPSGEESMMDQAKSKAHEVKEEAGEMLREQGDRGTTQAGDKVYSTAQDLHSVSDTLREQGRDSAARLVEQGASQAERVANYLRTSDTDTILNDVQDYARRQPWVVALGGLALGFVAARMVKAAGEAPPNTSRTSSFTAPSVTRERHLSPVSEPGPGAYETGSSHGSYSYGESSSFGTSGSPTVESRPDEDDDYRSGEAGAGGRPF